MRTKLRLFDTEIELKEFRLQPPSLKVIFVGDVCGKSSLLKTLISGKYPSNVKATIGTDFYHQLIELNDSKINLHIWDIPGVARYGKFCRVYFKETDIAIIGFDLTRKATFDSAIQWLEEINQHLDRNNLGKIILVGLKSDAAPDPELDIEELNQFVQDHNLCYMTASAKTGKNVEELFQQAVTLKMESLRLEEETSADDYQADEDALFYRVVHY